MYTIDLSGVIGVAVQLIVALIVLFAIPWVAKKNPTIATFLTKFILPLFVYGAEKYLAGLSGDEKREYVLTLFGKLNFNVDPAIVRLILEGICEKLDIEQGKYVQAAAVLIEGAADVIKPDEKK
jgi:hypothetical protein